MQVWLLPVDGGEARPLTKLPVDAVGPIWSPTGEHVAFAARVYPGKSPQETAAIDEAKAKEKSKVKIYDALMVRHWDEWDDGKRSHLFVAEVATGQGRDLTPKFAANVPPARAPRATNHLLYALRARPSLPAAGLPRDPLRVRLVVFERRRSHRGAL